MADFLIPGSVVSKAGIYRVAHSNQHKPDTESLFVEGLIMPSCLHDGCHVSYTLVRVASQISEDEDSQKVA